MTALPASLIAQTRLHVDTRGKSFTEITEQVARDVRASGIRTGLAVVYTRHTSCSLIINENADPTVRHDLERYFARLVPEGDPLYRHDAEGPDDMPAHIRTALTAVSLTIPVCDGELGLGGWQGIYLWEHRDRPHRRELIITVHGAG
ncbi:secondary thiamine-phosphate synthase enzyme YjbQ [Pseudomonadota bacterium AL_CKDN230030165-1A_HGKHYDSX7]